MEKTAHQQSIIDQFSKQAQAYSSLPAHSDALDLLIQITKASKDDDVLDIACGSGIVSCEFARHTNSVTGIDITPQMIQEARKLQKQNNLANITWQIADILPLPFPADRFSIVISRFGFHHFPEPEKVFYEMIRVCKPNGIIMVVDVALPNDKVEAYNKMEKLRDPSHAAALTTSEFEVMFTKSPLEDISHKKYIMSIDMDKQLAASFPSEEDRINLKTMIINDVGLNNLGVNVSRVDTNIMLHYPIHIYYGSKV